MKLSDRQVEIMQAGMEIISELGIQNLTIRNLARKISLTEGAIYRHFRSKEEILAAIAGTFRIKSTEVLAQVLKEKITGIGQVKKFFLERLNQFANDRALVLVLFSDEIFRDAPELQKTVHATMTEHRLLIVRALDEEKRSGNFPDAIDPENLFVIIMGALRLLVNQWRQSAFSFDLVRKGNELWDSLEIMLNSFKKKEEK